MAADMGALDSLPEVARDEIRIFEQVLGMAHRAGCDAGAVQDRHRVVGERLTVQAAIAASIRSSCARRPAAVTGSP